MSRRTLITGASRGFGLALARCLKLRGYSVMGVGRAPTEGADGSLDYYFQEDIRQLSFELEKCAGQADILINNAAVYLDDPRRGAPSIQDLGVDCLRTSLEINFIAATRLAQIAVGRMVERGFGRIVNISSGMARLSEFDGEAFAYRVSKLALNALTLALAETASKSSSHVSAFSYCPGWLPTDMGGPDATGSIDTSAEALVRLIEMPAHDTNRGFFRLDRRLNWAEREPSR